MSRRKIAALHVYADWAVRPGVTLAIFGDGSRLALFDSFKPACGYSTFWFALKTATGSDFWHVDVRDILPGAAALVENFPMDPALKMRSMLELLTREFASEVALLDAARPVALVVNSINNELLARSAAS